MAARENEIGHCRCPVCQSSKARLRVSAKSLVYVTCDSCNAQVFARSDRSDSLMRAMHIAAPADPVQVPAPADPVPAPIPPKPAARAMSWGVLGVGS